MSLLGGGGGNAVIDQRLLTVRLFFRFFRTQSMNSSIAMLATTAATPATAIPATVPLPSGALCARAAEAPVVVAVSGFAWMVLEDMKDMGDDAFEVLKVVDGAGAGVGISGVPVVGINVDNVDVADGSAIVCGIDVPGTSTLEPSIELPATVAVIVATVSGTEFIMPAHML